MDGDQIPAGVLRGDELANPRSLIHAVNVASVAARTAWLFFLAIMAYFFVAIAGVSHEELLLNKGVKLPILGIGLDLRSFFLFGPLVLLLVHFGLMVQHVMLSQKVIAFDNALRAKEDGPRRTHELRLELHSYFFTQALAGGVRSPVLGFFLHAMNWLSFVALPVLLFLFFQITFLPYHDVVTTWAHRIYLIADLIILTGVGIFLRKPESSFWLALWRTGRHHPVNFLNALILMAGAFFLSMFVITIPDEWLDKKLSAIPGFRAEIDQQVGSNKTEKKYAFVVTALMFEGVTSESDGVIHSILRFKRNLDVADRDLVPNREDKFGEISRDLRKRDLRFARLDRSDLHRADLTDADLSGASLVGTNLKDARLSCVGVDDELDPLEEQSRENCTILSGANLRKADLRGVDLRLADLTGARFEDAKLQGAKLQQATLEGATFSRTNFQGANLSLANLKGADLSWADLQGVDLSVASLHNAKFEHTNLTGANLAFARLDDANLSYAKLQGASLFGANLRRANMENANVEGADLRHATIWKTVLPKKEGLALADFRGVSFTPEKTQKVRQFTSNSASEQTEKWEGTPTHKAWTGLKENSESRDPGSYASDLTHYLGELACSRALENPVVGLSIVQRATGTSFNGNPDSLSQHINSRECRGGGMIEPRAIDHLKQRAKNYKKIHKEQDSEQNKQQ